MRTKPVTKIMLFRDGTSLIFHRKGSKVWEHKRKEACEICSLSLDKNSSDTGKEVSDEA